MLASEVAEAARLVLTQYLLVGLAMSPLKGLSLSAPASGFWLFLGCLAFEVPRGLDKAYMRVFRYPHFFLASCSLGFIVSLLGFYIIKSSSSITLKILVIVRSIILVVIAVMFMNDSVTRLEGVGYALSLAGSFWYTMEKAR